MEKKKGVPMLWYALLFVIVKPSELTPISHTLRGILAITCSSASRGFLSATSPQHLALEQVQERQAWALPSSCL